MEPFFVLSKHRANREFHKFTFSSWLQQILILGDNSHRYKKGNRKDHGVCGIFSVALKEGWLYCTDMPLSYLAVRKTTAFDFIWRPQADLNRC